MRAAINNLIQDSIYPKNLNTAKLKQLRSVDCQYNKLLFVYGAKMWQAKLEKLNVLTKSNHIIKMQDLPQFQVR